MAKKEETKELEKAAAAGLPAEMPENWGNDEAINPGERLVPKLHLMQGQSKLVAEEKAKMGDIANLVTGEVLGDSKNPVEFIPVKKLPSTWVVYDRVDSGKNDGQTKRQFKEIVEVGPGNMGWEWTVKDVNGKVIRENDYSINFLVLATKDSRMPLVLSFKRTSVKAGKKIVNHFDMCKIDGVPPASKALKLLAVKEMKDGQPYFRFDIDPSTRPSTKEEMMKAWEFFKLYKDQEVKIDNSDLMDPDLDSTHTVDAEVSETSQN